MVVTPVPPRPLTDPPPKGYDPKARCDYHMGGAPGHWTDRCYNLRHRIQDLRDQHLLEFKIETENKPNLIKYPAHAKV